MFYKVFYKAGASHFFHFKYCNPLTGPFRLSLLFRCNYFFSFFKEIFKVMCDALTLNNKNNTTNKNTNISTNRFSNQISPFIAIALTK